jgi:hypothetical protein
MRRIGVLMSFDENDPGAMSTPRSLSGVKQTFNELGEHVS